MPRAREGPHRSQMDRPPRAAGALPLQVFRVYWPMADASTFNRVEPATAQPTGVATTGSRWLIASINTIPKPS